MNREATGLAGTRHIVHETLGSTNAEALALARAGERGPLWVSAKAQTAGRGRRGNAWISGPGNLYATLLLSEPSPSRDAPQLSFVAALALFDALCACDARLAPRLKVKWPNDLLLDCEKVAGILIEGESTPIFAVVIGFGVNCVSHPAGTAYPATDLAAAGAPVSAERTLVALELAMAARIAQWHGGRGFASIRADWLARATGIGQAIKVRLLERELSGRFQGLDDAGCLLLETPAGLHPVAAGEVFGL
jgi:BirA family biotin operon repressor/biotin-[acetyl-CoA-carboxylase] ligase